MTKTEYYAEIKKICQDEYEKKHSWYETIYKNAVLIDALKKEQGNQEWIFDIGYYCRESIWEMGFYWNQMSEEDKNFIRKANELIGYMEEFQFQNLADYGLSKNWWEKQI